MLKKCHLVKLLIPEEKKLVSTLSVIASGNAFQNCKSDI